MLLNTRRHRSRPLTSLLSLLLLVSLALFSTLASALPSSTGDRILVVVDQIAHNTYSNFFASLTSRGYKVDFKAPRDAKPQLVQHDVLSYDHLILLSPASKSLAADISPQQLVEYLKIGGNMIVGLDSSASEMQRDLAREFSLEFEERGSALVDHFRYSGQHDAGNHTAVLVGGEKSAEGLSTGGLVQNVNVFSDETLRAAKNTPFLYRGIAHRVGANPLAFPLILPPATSYSSEVPALVKEQDAVVESTSYSTPPPVTVTTTKIVDGETHTTQVLSTPRAVPTVVKNKSASKLGKNGWVAKNRNSLDPLESRKELVAGLATSSSSNALVSLVSGFQLASNSARAVFLGSTELLSDAFFSDTQSGYVNKLVAADLSAWAFQEKSVLKVVATHHHRVKSGPSDTREDYEETEAGNKMYRIKDHVFYSVDLVQHHPQLGFIPADSSLDLQVSFQMLDPYITAHLTPLSASNFTHTSSPASSTSESEAFTRFATTFQVPDRHGVFTFVLDFKRPGLSFLHAKDTAPVRPFNHDEYPRFLSSSWPYIAGALSTSVGFLVFSAIWLTIRDDPPTGKKNN
ncbi:dolichyl-diphosphooligosaccharide-protein glycosyltransferase [Pseudozyma hubeiensis SY62]|uniref:Dolichyl-diphosphooligosaccharide--protein glycosyltransferase subunit WBP1 n=1 Tax=Pseudozyma hubeiensis (strain SY62) TaxID=1305764 RepID=R9P3M4_PSEHS|nr:dolichyl-diphosphooligosaccharide-protein glycosyltransferase [Pseudozyma hubeiensis SY62]GAC95884.1 dolichyl-diphosphooligosaccharide-protein glycosyltransferase [Pseudozyma hubeiensis SY62]